jgi:hypothetical protein
VSIESAGNKKKFAGSAIAMEERKRRSAATVRIDIIEPDLNAIR